MKVKNDNRSKFPNLSNWKEEAWKNQGFNGVRTRNLRVIGALLYQLSYEATHWERGQFIEFISPMRSEMMWSIYEIIHFLNWGRNAWRSPNAWFYLLPSPTPRQPLEQVQPFGPGAGELFEAVLSLVKGGGTNKNIASLILRSMCYFSRGLHDDCGPQDYVLFSRNLLESGLGGISYEN